MHRVCIFTGSREGRRPAYAAAARATGEAIARRGWGLVYGGASVGTMGAVADAALAAGCEVHGVIPRSMVDRELAHPGLTRLDVVGSMHERKALMHARSGAFLALPGGFGTLDETAEAITWMQLGLHAKPIGFLDVEGFWQPLVLWLERAVADGFVPGEHARRLVVESDVERMLDALGPK
ncbi:MAG TPA: TIGR00730 family Rossman fold protein [Polyangiaceae bacterium]